MTDNNARQEGAVYRDEKGRIYRGGAVTAGECNDCGNWRSLREGVCLECRGEVERIE